MHPEFGDDERLVQRASLCEAAAEPADRVTGQFPADFVVVVLQDVDAG